MNEKKTASTERKRGLRFLAWLFPCGTIALYLGLYYIFPADILDALRASGHVLKQVAGPMLLAFIMMMLLNLFMTPDHVIRFLGRRAGVKGVLLSSAAGIISMGPIYAWFPFLNALREKGASDFHLANFLSNRAVKPVFLPLLIVYFGWRFSLVFIGLNMLGAVAVAALVAFFSREHQRRVSK